MTAPSSPGRTWPVFIVECRLLVLAGAFAAPFFHSGRRGAGLSGVGIPSPSALFAHLGNQDDSRRQPGAELPGNRILDCAMVPLPLKDFSTTLIKGI